MRLRLLQLKNWRKRQRIKQHPAVYLQRHFVILMHLIFIFLQTTEQKAPHIGLGCSLHRQWGTGSCNKVITLPIAFSAFTVPAAIHRGTVTDTVIISSQDYATSLTQIKFLTNNSNDTAFVMYIIIGR